MDVNILNEPEYDLNFKEILMTALKQKGKSNSILIWWEKIFKPLVKKISMEYYKDKRKTNKEIKHHLESCLEELESEISNSYAEYTTMKKEAIQKTVCKYFNER